MKYTDFLNTDRIIVPAENSKSEVIIQLAALAAEQGVTQDADDLAQKLFYREQLMSTGIGLGLGIPHVRYSGLTEPFIALAVQPAGISEWDSMDGLPVRAAVMILVGEGEHKTHVRLLSQITRAFKAEGFMDKICQAEDTEAILALLQETAE